MFGVLSWLQFAGGELPPFTPERLQTTRPRPSVMNGGSCCRVSDTSPGRVSLVGDWGLGVTPASITDISNCGAGGEEERDRASTVFVSDGTGEVGTEGPVSKQAVL